MTLGQRIKELREKRCLTQEDFAGKLGLSKSAIGMYETDKREPNLETLDAIADFFNVDMEYLRGKTDCPNQYQWMRQSGRLNSAEAMQLAEDYDQRLDTWGQRAVRGLADTEMARTAANRAEQDMPPAQHEKQEKPVKAITALPKTRRRSDGFTEIKVYEQPAAAGLGNYLDEPPFHMEQYPADVIPEKADFGIVISGDSMEPEIHNGGTVFVQSAPSIDAGEVGIFVLDGKAYCKMLAVDHSKRQVQLLSVNPAYAPIPVGANADFWTLGRVLGQWTPGIDRYEP